MRTWTVQSMMGVVVTMMCLLSGCLESTVTTSCTSMAESRCGKCFDCALDTQGLAGSDLCGVTRGSDEETCVDDLTQICEAQSNARQLTNDERDECEEDLTAQTSCTPLYEFATQGHQSLPRTCRVLF